MKLEVRKTLGSVAVGRRRKRGTVERRLLRLEGGREVKLRKIDVQEGEGVSRLCEMENSSKE